MGLVDFIRKIFSKVSSYFLRFFLLLYDFCRVCKINFLAYKHKKRGQKVFLVEITTTGEFFFLKNVLKELQKEKNLLVLMSRPNVRSHLKPLVYKFFGNHPPVVIDSLWYNCIPGVDFYMNGTMSYDIKIPKRAKHSIHFPHVITSKTKCDVFSIAAERLTDIFSPGSIYEKDFLAFCRDKGIKKVPKIHKVGSPKSDSLFDHTVDKRALLKKINLDPDLPVVFYAPTWNQGTSPFTWIDTIMDIPKKHKVNLIVKIHPGVYTRIGSQKATGGIDWGEFFSDTELLAKNRIYNVLNDQDSDDYDIISDVTITDISTIWIEFYLLRKPIIFLDIPEFFKNFERNALGEFEDIYGYLVKKPDQFHATIESILEKNAIPKKAEPLDEALVYNKGQATQAAVKAIKSLY